MQVAYICGPYRSSTIRGTVENIRAAEAVALAAWKKGYAVICPHMNTALFDGACPEEVWLEGDLEIIRRLDPERGDCLIVVENWKESEGSKREVDEAIKLGLNVTEYYWSNYYSQWMSSPVHPPGRKDHMFDAWG